MPNAVQLCPVQTSAVLVAVVVTDDAVEVVPVPDAVEKTLIGVPTRRPPDHASITTCVTSVRPAWLKS